MRSRGFSQQHKRVMFVSTPAEVTALAAAMRDAKTRLPPRQFSLLTISVAGRLAMALAAIAVLWAAVFWALW